MIREQLQVKRVTLENGRYQILLVDGTRLEAVLERRLPTGYERMLKLIGDMRDAPGRTPLPEDVAAAKDLELLLGLVTELAFVKRSTEAGILLPQSTIVDPLIKRAREFLR